MTTTRIFVKYVMPERTIISLVVNPSDVIGSVKTKIQEKEAIIFPTNRLILYFSPVEECEDGSVHERLPMLAWKTYTLHGFPWETLRKMCVLRSFLWKTLCI